MKIKLLAKIYSNLQKLIKTLMKLECITGLSMIFAIF